jgi:hypothetical protein
MFWSAGGKDKYVDAATCSGCLPYLLVIKEEEEEEENNMIWCK